MGKLNKGAPARSFELGSFIFSLNWAKRSWTWARVDAKGDLKHQVLGITKTERLGKNNDVLTIYAFYFFKLVIVAGRAK